AMFSTTARTRPSAGVSSVADAFFVTTGATVDARRARGAVPFLAAFGGGKLLSAAGSRVLRLVLRSDTASILRLEHHDTERRQGERQRMLEAMRAYRIGHHTAEIARAAAAVDIGIAVEHFPPEAAARHADAVLQARNRREIAHDEHRRAGLRITKIRDHARLRVARVDPAEGFGIEVARMQRGVVAIERIEIRDPALDARVLGILEHPPFERLLVRPFAALPELAAHEQEL